MRTLVDANVVLRYMLRDDENQFPAAERTIREGAFLLPEVLAEIVYVLLGVYSVPREDIASRLQILVKEVQSEHPDILTTALSTFGTTKLDFIDCLLAAYNNHLGDKVVSFDRKLNRSLQQITVQRVFAARHVEHLRHSGEDETRRRKGSRHLGGDETR